MENSIKNKILASVLIFILMIANFQGIITEGINVYASSIERQTSETNHKNVDFNAQFMVSNNEKKYSIRENISSKEIYLNIFSEVKEAGYLKTGEITLKDEEGNKPNFSLNKIEEPDTVQNIDYSNYKITLNQINNGENVDVNIPINLTSGEVFNLKEFSENTIVTFSGIYVDKKGEEKEIEKEIKLNAEWKEEVEAVLTQELVKVLPYELEAKKGVVLAEKVTLGIKDFKLPIKSVDFEVEVPKIGEVLPVDVRVENLNATLNIHQEYKDGKLNITIKNEVSEDNTVIWKKALEELEITYIFENIENSEIKESQSFAKLDIECYSSEKTVVETENSNTINILEKLGNNVEENMNKLTDIIYKGNMLNTGLETEFKVISNINVAYENLVEKIDVIYGEDKFVLTEKEVDANTYYKKLSLSKQNFDKILGELGEVKIYSADTLLTTINNNSTVDEDENIVFNFENNLSNEIRIETTKPIYSGRLKIEFLKAIKGITDYTRDEIKNISSLKLQTVVEEVENQLNIEFQNPTTKVQIETNTNILSTVVENKGVEFVVTLNNNNLDCDLFKNPKIEIGMPEAVTDVKINSLELLLEDELKIKDYKYINESNSIVINLEGIQTKYNLSEMDYGATIIVNADISLDKLAVNKKDKVKVFVVNELSTSYESVLEEKGYIEKNINIIAPLGLISLNSAEGYNGETEETVAIGGNEAIGKIEPNAQTKTIAMKITAINNYNSEINNIRILGRVPFKGNKSLVDGTDLGTTFDAILQGKIVSEVLQEEKYSVYFSENGDATENIDLEENKWTLEPEDLAKVKSYLIVLKDYTMQIGEKVEFKYDIEVPENLELGNSAHGTYIVYYDNKKDDVVFENTSVPSVIGFTTGEAPKLEVSINSDIAENEVAKSGQIIKYTIKVKNIGSIDSTQVFVTSNIPEGVTYAELVYGGNYDEDYYKLNVDKKSFNKLIGDLKAGEEQIVEYLVRVNEDLKSKQEIITKASVSAKDLPEMIDSLESKNLIDSGSILLELKSNIKADEKVKIGDSITYTAIISNISEYDINNVVAKVVLPEGLEYKNSYIKNVDSKGNYSEVAREISWNIGKLLKDRHLEIVFEVLASNKTNNIDVYVNVLGENVQEHKSNTIKTKIANSNVEVKQESTIPEGYVSIGDKIEYKIEVKNTGDLDATNVQIIDFVPEGMKYIETNYEIKGTNKTIKTSSDNEAKLEINIPANETLNMSITVKAEETEKEKKATNIVKVINDGQEAQANDITHIIEARTLGASQGNSQNGEPSIDIVDTYKISGIAWMDSNENGKKDSEEAVLAGITVMLLDKKTGNIAKDATEQELNTTTEGTGAYTFRNLKPGEYIVVFIYDNSKYTITDYKKSEVEESKNSDVARMTININGEEKAVAVSDTLNIVDQNIYNVNIGLKEISGFDLKLDKYVSKITVKDGNGVKTYNYDNTKLAKIEINSKTAEGTTLIVEYKLIVTNEGSVAGYAKKIADYIPQQLKFSSELNSSWYLAEDGNVYTSELANAKINPGESRELTLVLTKQITGENVGLINNNAEISESYNDYGTADTDSVEGNKKAGEDDMSNADIYIGIKTGSPVTYFGLSLVIMIVLALGAYLINTKILIQK